jgi:hypothetical protein
MSWDGAEACFMERFEIGERAYGSVGKLVKKAFMSGFSLKP